MSTAVEGSESASSLERTKWGGRFLDPAARIIRIIRTFVVCGRPPAARVVELNIDTEVTGGREEGSNIFGEIPGADPALGHQMVIVGGHLDSWAAGTGATDDGAGVVIALEVSKPSRERRAHAEAPPPFGA